MTNSFDSILVAICSVSAVLWTGGLIARQIQSHKRSEDLGAGLRFLGFAIFVPLLQLAFPDALRIVVAVYALLTIVGFLLTLLIYLSLRSNRRGGKVQEASSMESDATVAARWYAISIALASVVAIFPTNVSVAACSLAGAFAGFQLLSNYLGREGEEYLEESILKAVAALLGFVSLVRHLNALSHEKAPAEKRAVLNDKSDGGGGA